MLRCRGQYDLMNNYILNNWLMIDQSLRLEGRRLQFKKINLTNKRLRLLNY